MARLRRSARKQHLPTKHCIPSESLQCIAITQFAESLSALIVSTAARGINMSDNWPKWIFDLTNWYGIRFGKHLIDMLPPNPQTQPANKFEFESIYIGQRLLRIISLFIISLWNNFCLINQLFCFIFLKSPARNQSSYQIINNQLPMISERQ